MNLGVTLRNFYEVDCYRDGKLLWQDGFENLVTTVGKNALLDYAFRTGVAALSWFVGLVDSTSFTAYSVTDTMSTHGGWIEASPYSDLVRPDYVPAAASAGSMSNAAARALFNVITPATIQGAFLVDDDTVDGVAGVLYGVGSFVTPRTVIAGDVLAIKITLTD